MEYKAFFEDAFRPSQSRKSATAFLSSSNATPAHFPYARWHRDANTTEDIIMWCSNDYLGMGLDPQVIETMCTARNPARRRRRAAPAISRAPTIHWSRSKPNSPICTANRAASSSPPAGFLISRAISAIGSLLPDCLILSDAYNHNSMIEGIKRSGAERQIFRHNDLDHLEDLLKTAGRERPKLIAFESLYSMDGDIAQIARSPTSPSATMR